MAALGRHAAVCVHELNNLMTAVLFRAEDALARGDAEVMRRALEVCQRQAREVIELSRRATLLSNGSNDRAETCRIAEVLDEAIAAHPRSFEKDGVAVALTLSADASVVAPRVLLRQLLHHLVHAVREPAARGAMLQIEVRRDAELVIEIRHLRCRASADAARAFLSGSQALDTESLSTSLDLAVCRELARECGAVLSVEPLEQSGARFCVAWRAPSA